MVRVNSDPNPTQILWRIEKLGWIKQHVAFYGSKSNTQRYKSMLHLNPSAQVQVIPEISLCETSKQRLIDRDVF